MIVHHLKLLTIKQWEEITHAKTNPALKQHLNLALKLDSTEADIRQRRLSRPSHGELMHTVTVAVDTLYSETFQTEAQTAPNLTKWFRNLGLNAQSNFFGFRTQPDMKPPAQYSTGLNAGIICESSLAVMIPAWILRRCLRGQCLWKASPPGFHLLNSYFTHLGTITTKINSYLWIIIATPCVAALTDGMAFIPRSINFKV